MTTRRHRDNFTPPDGRMEPIAGFPGYFVTEAGEIISKKQGYERVLKGGIGGSPRKYRLVSLHRDGEQLTRRVHRIVLETFRGPPPDGHEARHLNGDSLDNRLENLAWGTKAENQQDKDRHGTTKKGSEHGMSVLSEGDIPTIRTRLANGEQKIVIAADYGVSDFAIYSIAIGRTWRHVP